MQSLHISQRRIGPGSPVYMVAEIGVNHNGSLDMAKRMILAARDAGADAVKFQTFCADRVVSSEAPKAAYQLQTTDPGESQFDMLSKLELAESDWRAIVSFCRDQEIAFFSTPYDFEDVDLLDALGVEAFKVASGQAVESGFLEHVAARQKPVLLSTGMCDMAEVAQAVGTIRGKGNEQLVILQCTTNYPSAVEDANLRAMSGMGTALDTLFGYSDHTLTNTASVAATALGACVIERHFTLDKAMKGPDHSCSSTPDEFKALVLAVREVEACLGSARKHPSAAETRNAPGMRRSLFARRAIAKGEVLDWSNLIFKRPGTGIAGMAATAVPGHTAATDIPKGVMLDMSMIGTSS